MQAPLHTFWNAFKGAFRSTCFLSLFVGIYQVCTVDDELEFYFIVLHEGLFFFLNFFLLKLENRAIYACKGRLPSGTTS